MKARLLLLAALALSAQATFAAPAQVLFDFNAPFDPAAIATSDARASRAPAGDALLVNTGHQQPWPGITLPAPDGAWDLSSRGFVSVCLRNSGTNAVTVFCRVDNPGADGTDHCVSGSAALNPGATETLKVSLKRVGDDQLGGKLFGMRGYPVAPGASGTIDAAHITQLVIFVSKPSSDHAWEIQEISAGGAWVAPTASTRDADPFFPFIDTFGQYRHRSWPGKVQSLEDLVSRKKLESDQLVANPGPKGWDQYGGWASGPKREATGFFRTEKVKGKWWLIDPEGRLFFSQGIDCVRMLDTTPIEERADWFSDFPGKDPAFASFLSHGYALKGHYAGRNPECFSFAGANLLRKYGPDWSATHPRLIHQRLRSWGLNTIANWSDERIRSLRLTPYTDSIGSGRTPSIEGSEGYWGKFPDVFHPAFTENLRQAMQAKQGKSAGDPWCIGYFSDNEMSWGDEISLGLGALVSPPDQPAKKALVADLQARYSEVSRLNAAWGTEHTSWEALLENRKAPDRKKASADLAAFSGKIAEQYFRSVKEAIKAVAPHQLYLGCRFAWANPRAAAAAAKHCDVVSYNLYRRSVADFRFDGGADVPLIIGEFHFGALDRGLFHTGLVPVETQEARANAYRDYVRGALRHPQFVGCHWFQYQDEPTTGRVYDEENYQIGFVDIADTPYSEMIAASREIADHLYDDR